MKSWIEAFLNANALRWSLFLPLAFACGAAFYLTASFEPSWSQMAVPACLCAAIMAFSRRRHTFVPFVSLLCVLFFLGGSVAKFKAHALDSPVLLEQIEFVRVEGVLAAVEHGDNGNRLLIQPSTISGLARDRTPRFVRVAQKKQTTISPGRPITCPATLSPPPYSGVPGDFNFRRQAFFRQLGGVGYVLGDCSAMALDLTDRGLLGAVQDRIGAIRRKVALHVQSVAGEVSGGMAAAMVTGDRSLMTSEDIYSLRSSGLAHLLAISGLHMSLAGGVFFFLAYRFFLLIEPLVLRLPADRTAAAFALTACVVYLALSGGSVATQRAFIMAATAFTAKVLDKSALSLRNLGTSMFIVTALQPESVVSPGFQMSFSAAGALIAIYDLQRVRQSGRTWYQRIVVFVIGVAAASLTASLATAPFAAFHFNRVAALSIPANMAVAPIISFWSAPSAALAGIAAPLQADGFFLRSFGLSLEWVLFVARSMSAGEQHDLNAMPIEAFALFAFATAIFVILHERSKLLAVLPCAFAAVIWWLEGATAILIDDYGDTFLRTEANWTRIGTPSNEGSGLAPLQIGDDPLVFNCNIPVCSHRVASTNWFIEIDQYSPNDSKWLVRKAEHGEPTRIDLSSVRGARVSIRNEIVKLRVSGTVLGNRPWSPNLERVSGEFDQE